MWRLQEAEVFDAELKGVVEALQEAVRQTARTQSPLTILLDSQAAIARLGHSHTRVGPTAQNRLQH